MKDAFSDWTVNWYHNVCNCPIARDGLYTTDYQFGVHFAALWVYPTICIFFVWFLIHFLIFRKNKLISCLNKLIFKKIIGLKEIIICLNKIKKNYKGSPEMYNAHSYLGTDKIQTYKKIPVSGESGMLWFTSVPS
jgi:hypothetical protein